MRCFFYKSIRLILKHPLLFHFCCSLLVIIRQLKIFGLDVGKLFQKTFSMKNIGIEKSCDIFLWMLIMGGGKFWNYKGIQCSSHYLLAYILEDKFNYVNLSFKDYDRRYFIGILITRI